MMIGWCGKVWCNSAAKNHPSACPWGGGEFLKGAMQHPEQNFVHSPFPESLYTRQKKATSDNIIVLDFAANPLRNFHNVMF